MPLDERVIRHLQSTADWLNGVIAMIADIIAHDSPSVDALAAAPVLERWETVIAGEENLSGYAGGFEPRHWQAYTVIHVDHAGGWAATMSGLLRLGMPSQPEEH